MIFVTARDVMDHRFALAAGTNLLFFGLCALPGIVLCRSGACGFINYDLSSSCSMKISFHGAAGTVTGSKHIVHLRGGKKILLDCGMFQGLGPDTMPMNRDWGFDPADITYVIISHAHI